ncbi:hypothetical protein ACS0TY_013915 [Phlomoides rotata]
MGNLMENLNISQEEGDDLVLEEECADHNLEKLNLYMGRFLITDQTYNFMSSRMASVWKPSKRVSFKNIRSCRFLIQFYHKLDLARVVEGGPWSFDNHSLIIHRL